LPFISVRDSDQSTSEAILGCGKLLFKSEWAPFVAEVKIQRPKLVGVMSLSEVSGLGSGAWDLGS
jgi:hypothetical protein